MFGGDIRAVYQATMPFSINAFVFNDTTKLYHQNRMLSSNLIQRAHRSLTAYGALYRSIDKFVINSTKGGDKVIFVNANDNVKLA